MPHPLADRVGQITCKSGFADDAESEARRAKRLEYKRRWAAKNPDKVRAAAARYRDRHPDRRKKTKAAWIAKNRDKTNAHNRAWRKRNPDKLRAAKRLWRYRYPELAREHDRLRNMRKRARRMNAVGDASTKKRPQIEPIE